MSDFFKKNKVYLFLIAIIILGSFLRLYNFRDLVRFNNDQVRDSKVVDRMIENKNFPLLGPPAASTDFKLGPAYYYMEYLSALIFGNNPSGIAFFVAILGIASIPLFFVFMRFYFSEIISLFLTFLYAISFYAVKYSRFTWNPNVIPFFLLLFLILLLKLSLKKEFGEKSFGLFVSIGVILGIGIQLHTMLLVIMPLLFFSSCTFIYLKTRDGKKIISGFVLVVFFALLLNSTIFVHDLKNGGKNSKAFFSVAKNRTGENISIAEKFLRTGQFFTQSSVYVLSGYEPTKNWLEIKKFLQKKDLSEIISAALGTLFLLGGFLLTVVYFLRERDEKRKVFLGILLGTIAFSSFVFMLVTEMLKSRFFIIIIFLPYIFLGVIFKKASEFLEKRTVYLLAIMLSVLFLFLNLKVFSGIFSDINGDYPRKDSLYGGISLKEASDISRFMVNSSQKETLSGKKIYLSGFEFYQSVNYFNKKSKLNVSLFPKGNLENEAVLFVIGKSKNKKRILDKNSKFYSLIDSGDLGRFTVFIFQNKQ